MNFEQPTPIQAATIPVALLGRDICACAVTGSGRECVIVPAKACMCYGASHGLHVCYSARDDLHVCSSASDDLHVCHHLWQYDRCCFFLPLFWWTFLGTILSFNSSKLKNLVRLYPVLEYCCFVFKLFELNDFNFYILQSCQRNIKITKSYNCDCELCIVSLVCAQVRRWHSCCPFWSGCCTALSRPLSRASSSSCRHASWPCRCTQSPSNLPTTQTYRSHSQLVCAFS